MAHPMQEHKAYKVERSRVKDISGAHEDEQQDRNLIRRMLQEHEQQEMKVEGTLKHRKRGGRVDAMRDALAVSGKPARERMDKPARARGGKVKSKKGVNVNVIVAPQAQQHAPLPAGGPAGIPPPPVAGPRPPIPGVGGPPMPPGGPPGGPPMPMGPRHIGGRAYAAGGKVVPRPAWKEGIRAGTKVQHAPGKQDMVDVGRGPVITKATGGAVEHPLKGGMGPKFKGGAMTGEARLQKRARARRNYKKAV